MKFLAAIFALLCFILPATAAPNFPALTGRVVDDDNILSEQTKEDLIGKLAGLEQKTSRQLVVVTIPSLQGYEISDYGYQLGRAWGIGQKTLNNGILLIVAPTEHKVRIEVGYGLEPIVTDALSEVVIQTQVLPKFRQGDFNGGVQAGADALIQQLSLDQSEAERRAAVASQQLRDQSHDTGGGGGLVGFLIILFIFIAISRVFGGWGLLPFLFMNGGFSGGGGSFGGGGSSGSW